MSEDVTLREMIEFTRIGLQANEQHTAVLDAAYKWKPRKWQPKYYRDARIQRAILDLLKSLEDDGK